MIIVDTGPLIAVADVDDRHHARCVDVLERARRDRHRLVVPAFVAAETCFMLSRDGGSAVEAAFLRSFEKTGQLELAQVEPADLERMADLVTQYADLGLGAVDASVIALAERLGVTEIATVDLRHFRVVRPRHTTAFTLLPG